MSQFRRLLPLLILLGCLLGACTGCKSRTAGAGGEVRATDTIRYARNLRIAYCDG